MKTLKLLNKKKLLIILFSSFLGFSAHSQEPVDIWNDGISPKTKEATINTNPKKKSHILVVPKGEYVDLDHFNTKASEKEIIELSKSITHIVKMLKISSSEEGYRVITNIGKNGGQEVPHLHYHIFGGEKVGKIVV